MWETFINMVDGVKLTTLAVLIGVDFLLGVIVALKEGSFQFSKLASFLNTSILGYVGGYLLLGVVATVDSNFETAVTAGWVALDATLVAMILAKAKKLGLPIPNSASKLLGS